MRRRKGRPPSVDTNRAEMKVRIGGQLTEIEHSGGGSGKK